MNNTELKQIVARHFDYAPSGTGQYLHGDWFTPKHKDSLEYALDELLRPIKDAEDRLEELEEHDSKVEELEAEIEKLKEKINEAAEVLA